MQCKSIVLRSVGCETSVSQSNEVVVTHSQMDAFVGSKRTRNRIRKIAAISVASVYLFGFDRLFCNIDQILKSAAKFVRSSESIRVGASQTILILSIDLFCEACVYTVRTENDQMRSQNGVRK